MDYMQPTIAATVQLVKHLTGKLSEKVEITTIGKECSSLFMKPVFCEIILYEIIWHIAQIKKNKSE